MRLQSEQKIQLNRLRVSLPDVLLINRPATCMTHFHENEQD